VVGTAPVSAPSYPTIEQVFRFDITKEWVYQHWARKSTGPTDVGLFSVRVQLVTGTGSSALAGVLTYFFNNQNQVEHISFHGRTGDPAPFVAYITRSYGLRPASAPTGEKAYQRGNGEQVQSELRTRAESVVGASPIGAHVVELELARPGSKRFLPPRGTGLQVPPVASAPATPPPPTTTEKVGSSVKSAVNSYFDGARYATPQEETNVLWKRWPN
jgi:hypothetical protein